MAKQQEPPPDPWQPLTPDHTTQRLPVPGGWIYALHTWDLDDGSGCCGACGVSLELCDGCTGLGYHRDGCPELYAEDVPGEVTP